VGRNRSTWFIALVLGLAAGALPVAGSADTGPVPVDPPACVSVPPVLTTSCPQPSPSQPQAAGVSSAQSNSSQARSFAVSATPDLARTLVAAVNGARRAHGLRPLAYSGALASAATEHAKALATADAVQQWLDSRAHRRVLLTKSWRELGIGVVSAVAAPGTYGGRDVQIAAAEFGLRRH